MKQAPVLSIVSRDMLFQDCFGSYRSYSDWQIKHGYSLYNP